MTEALKPCGHCGSDWVSINRPANGSQPAVECRACNAMGPFTAGMTDEQIITAWNTRQPTDREAVLEEAAERAREELYPSNPEADWTPYAKDMAHAAVRAEAAILALKASPTPRQDERDAPDDISALWCDEICALVDAAFETVSRNPSDHETAIAYRRAIAEVCAKLVERDAEIAQLKAALEKVTAKWALADATIAAMREAGDALATRLRNEGLCSRPEGCVCGGDTPAVRAGCGWFTRSAAEEITAWKDATNDL